MAFGYNIDQRKMNKKNHIVDLFRQHKMLSKASARELSGYSMDTIISIFDSLIEEEVIMPTAGKQKQKGRRAQFYTLNHNKQAYLGVTFNHTGIFSSLVSFSSEVIEQNVTSFDDGMNKNEFVEHFRQNIHDLLKKEDNYAGIVSSVGCSLPGDVDHMTGTLNSYVVMPGLSNLNFKDIISDMFPHVPVRVDPKVKSMTSFLLKDYKLFEKYKKILFISARTGAANGIIFNGDIFTGHGEFRHIKVSDEDVTCSCGRKGCLDCYFSLHSFYELLCGHTGNKQPVDEKLDSSKIIEKLSNLYETDPVIAKELDKRLYYFIIALIDILNVTVPEIIILSGELFTVYKNPAEKILSMLFEKFLDFDKRCVDFGSLNIVYRDLGFEIAALGICNEMIRDDWNYTAEE